jgi:ribosomal protein S18 acetylase RimI-like enzyme
MIVSLDTSHANAAAQLHLHSLTGLLCDLGSVATRAFYHGAAHSNSSFAYVFVHEDKLLGFVLGSSNAQRLRREILANSFFSTLLGTCLGFIRNPRLIRAFFASLKPTENHYDSQAPELTYLAVDGKARASGVGRQLIEYFGQQIAKSGVTSYELSVDADNQNAIRFYVGLGFVEIGRYQEFEIDHIRFRMQLT